MDAAYTIIISILLIKYA